MVIKSNTTMFVMRFYSALQLVSKANVELKIFKYKNVHESTKSDQYPSHSREGWMPTLKLSFPQESFTRTNKKPPGFPQNQVGIYIMDAPLLKPGSHTVEFGWSLGCE